MQSDVGSWSTTLKFLPDYRREEWTPFQDSDVLKWERIGKDRDALEKAIVIAQRFEQNRFPINGMQKCFLLYSRKKEYGDEDNTTVASLIRYVASDQFPQLLLPHAPAMLDMLIAYPQKIPDALIDVEKWKDETVDAVVHALIEKFDCELRIIHLVETLAQTFPRHYEQLNQVSEQMHHAYVNNMTSKHRSKLKREINEDQINEDQINEDIAKLRLL